MHVVLVTGGRTYRDRAEIRRVLDALDSRRPIDILVHGGARGADHFAAAWAMHRGIQPVRMDALWDFYGNRAGSLRNQKMWDFARPDTVVAFPGGRGTANMMRIAYDAQRAGAPVEIIDVEDGEI